MTKAMDQIVIPHDFVDELPDDVVFEAGTVVLITGLRRNWKTRVPGRPVAGRSRTRLGRLRQDLELLLRQFGTAAPDFEIALDSDHVIETSDVGVIAPYTADENAAYSYTFSLELDGKGHPLLSRKLTRSELIADELGGKRSETFRKKRVSPEQASREKRPEGLSCGPIHGVFRYNPPPPRTRAKSEEVKSHGVLLYRDGVLVEPYGLDSNDWLGVGARKAQRQGHALVQPATFWGEVDISRKDNPDLRDMANRLGLLDTDEAADFLSHVRAEFRHFESLVTTELERRWTSKEDRAAAEAGDRIRALGIRARMFAHSLRQPLTGLAFDLAALDAIVQNTDMDDVSKARISQVVGRMRGHVRRAEDYVNGIGNVSDPKFTTARLVDLIDSAMATQDDYSTEQSVALRRGPVPDVEVVTPEELVVEAIAQLIRNGIEAERPAARDAHVSVSASASDTQILIRVEDNGTGISGVAPGTSLDAIDRAGTKARPPGGLTSVADVMAFANGSAQVISSDESGLAIQVRLPRRISVAGQRASKT